MNILYRGNAETSSQKSVSLRRLRSGCCEKETCCWCYVRSPVGCSLCSRPPAAVWAEQLHSPAGRWPARSHSSYWPMTPSCQGRKKNNNNILKHIFPSYREIQLRFWKPAYLDSSSRNLAPAASWSFLRCQFKSWIFFLQVKMNTSINRWEQGKEQFLTGKHHPAVTNLNFWSSFWAVSIMKARLLKKKNKVLRTAEHCATVFKRSRSSHTRCTLSRHWFHIETWFPGSRFGPPGAPAGPWSCSRTPATL